VQKSASGAARSAQEKIAALEEMLRVIPKHKGTEGLQGDLKARLARLRKEPERKGASGGIQLRHPSRGRRTGGAHRSAQCGQVVARCRPDGDARPEVADYPFTTREPVPGMMPFEDIAFQLVDLISAPRSSPCLSSFGPPPRPQPLPRHP